MESLRSLDILRHSYNKIEDENANVTEPPKFFVKLSQIGKFSPKSDIASTCADDTISTMTSVSSSPKRSSHKRASFNNDLDTTLTLKDIATKRKYSKRMTSKQTYADFPTKKVKKAVEELQTKSKTESTQEGKTTMVVWENRRAKIVDDQHQVQPYQNLEYALKTYKHTTSHSFKKLNHALQWTDAETKKFYRALEIFGLDFSMIATMFPRRNRLQIKNKFIKEEKLNFDCINERLAKAASNDKSRIKFFRKINILKDNLPLIEQAGRPQDIGTKLRSRAESFSSMYSTDEVDKELLNDIGCFLECNS